MLAIYVIQRIKEGYVERPVYGVAMSQINIIIDTKCYSENEICICPRKGINVRAVIFLILHVSSTMSAAAVCNGKNDLVTSATPVVVM